MKKTLILFMAVIFAASLATPGFAETLHKRFGLYYKMIQGTVASTASGSFVIKDKDNGKMKTIAATAKQLSGLSAGDWIKVVVPEGSNKASRISR